MTFDHNEFVENRKIALKSLTGSHNYNLHTHDSDEDFKFFVFPTFDDLYTNTMFSKSIVSDTVDATVHDVRHLLDLIWKANTNFIEVLFGAFMWDNSISFIMDKKESLARMNLPTFFGANMGMHTQKMDTLHKGTANTQSLIAEFGYDTKQACHALRVLLILSRYMEKGCMADALRFGDSDPARTALVNIKAGNYSEWEFNEIVEEWFDTHLKDVREFYKNAVPDKLMYGHMKAQLKEVVKAKLL